MQIVGADYLTALLAQEGFAAKMVFNAHGAIIFPVTQEHRDQKAPGISYADDYAGNALAAMLGPRKIEVRFHRDFTDSQVAELIRLLVSQSELMCLRGWQVTYKGRSLQVAT